MSTDAITPLCHRMIEDMSGRKLCAGTRRGHIRSCKRFAAFLNRSPDAATTEDIRRFQLHLAEVGVSICNMIGLRFLFRVTLRRLDLATEVYHIHKPQKISLVMSPDETRRLLGVAANLKVRTPLLNSSLAPSREEERTTVAASVADRKAPSPSFLSVNLAAVGSCSRSTTPGARNAPAARATS